MKGLITIIYLFVYFPISSTTPSLNLPISFSVTLRPGAVFFPQFVPLTSHIYTYVNYSSNGTALNVYISEKDYANPGDTVPKYQFYLNSETNSAYYVDGENCVKTPMSHISIFCLYVPSYITNLFLDGFIKDGFSFNKSYNQCPLHSEVSCNRWYDLTNNITVYADGNVLEVMLLSGILYKPMVYDNFKPSGPIPKNFVPQMECKESDEFLLCEGYTKELKFDPFKSRMQDLLGL